MSFAETKLELGIDYGTRASLRFNTTVLVDGSGAEQRNANWSQPLGKWQIGDRYALYWEINYFLDFHAARKGSLEGFRFKDWSDYQSIKQQLGIGDGTKQAFQLIKTYTIGSNSVIRPILKPVANTIRIYIDNVELHSGWSVDITTGIVIFTTAPNVGAIITADFEFDVPVRFEQDKIDFRFDAYEVGTGEAIFQLQNLSLVELRLKPTINISPFFVPVSINEVLDLGYDYGTVGGPAYNTAVTSVGAGYEKRTNNWSQSRGKWQIGDRTLTRNELDYLIAFFRVTKGASSGFNYQDWQSNQNKQVRFESDSIEFRFDAVDLVNNNAIFYLSGSSVIETIQSDAVSYSSHEIANSFLGTDSCYVITYNCSNGQAVPVAGTGGTYSSIAELEANLIYPTFTGGQCPALYDVTFTFQHACHAGTNCDLGTNSGTSTVRVDGPVEKADWEIRTLDSSATLYVYHNGKKKFIFGCGGGICTNWELYTAEIISVVRVDGLPDNCGNLPTTCPIN